MDHRCWAERQTLSEPVTVFVDTAPPPDSGKVKKKKKKKGKGKKKKRR